MDVDEVRSRRALYDLGHPDYKDLKKKDYLWRDVSAIVKLNELECKKRWKGLRDSYKRCKRMEQVASGSAAETPKRKWRFLEPMSFLENVTSSRRTVGNICNDDFGDEEPVETTDLDSTDGFLSSSSPCLTSTSRVKKKQGSDKFQDFLDLAATSICETCGSFAQKQDSTALHFASLATKIKEANMPLNIVNKIEAKNISFGFFGN